MTSVNTQKLCAALALLTLSCSTYAGSWSSEQSIAGMDVWLYTPDTVSSVGDGRAAMIVMHGCAQTGDDFRNGANLEVTAETYGMVMAVPTAPNGGVGLYGCWDYYDTNHTRLNRHNDNLIQLGQFLQNRADVDPNQVYIAGLSSGATQAQVTGCLAPEVFAGVGSTGGPVMGTSESQAFLVAGSASTARNLCESWAGSQLSLLQTQMRNIAHGTSDSLVPFSVAETSMQGIGLVKGISKNAGSNSLAGATEETWGTAGDTTKLVYQGMDHRWAAGGDSGGGTYIDNNSSRVNYASYLANFFANNNPRVNSNQGPAISNLLLSSGTQSIVVSVDITDTDGVSSSTATLTDAATGSTQSIISLTNVGSSYGGEFTGLSDGLYDVTIEATDSLGKSSTLVQDDFRVGPPPPSVPPTLSDYSVAVAGNCATATGIVVDADDDLDRVEVSFGGDVELANVSVDRFSAERCGLAGGLMSVTATAYDLEGNDTSASVDVDIADVVSANLQTHINEGRLDYVGYSTCYLEYGATTSFQLALTEASASCRWEDADASCVGPQVACDDEVTPPTPPPPPPPPPVECEEFTSNNSTHQLNGRAVLQFVNLYYAVGSGEYLGLSYNVTTLNSSDGSNWSLGGCP